VGRISGWTGGLMISTVQTKSSNSGSSYVNSFSPQWSSNVTAGNFLVLAISCSSTDSDAITSVTDTSGNTWSRISTLNSAGLGISLELDIWICTNCLGGTTPTVTIQLATDNFSTISIVMREYQGVATSSPADVSVTSRDDTYTQTHASGNTSTTTQANELVVAVMAYTNSGDTLTVSSGYTTVVNESCAGEFSGIGYADKVISSTGTQSATFTSTGFRQHFIYVGTFKEATAPAANTTNFFQFF